MKTPEINEPELLAGAYRDFNARHMDAVLNRLAPEVMWANGMEGGHVFGREAVRAYWTRQWETLDPHVAPLAVSLDENGRWVVEVHQLVRDVGGTVLSDMTVHHSYRIAHGLIERMDILEVDKNRT